MKINNICLLAILAMVFCSSGSALGYVHNGYNYQLTANTYSPTANWAQGAVSEFGPAAQVVDWNTIKAEFGDSVDSLRNFLDGIGVLDVYNAPAVTWNGSQIWSETRSYGINRAEGSVPGGYLIHDQILDNWLLLGSWPADRQLIVSIPIPNPNFNLDGEYWFGSLSVAVDTNEPWGKQGTVTITDSNWSQEWDDYDGHHTFTSTFTTTAQPDGSINVNLSSGPYNIAWNGDVMIHADAVPDANNRLGIDLIIRKAAGIQSSDVVGNYSNFGHWLGWNSRWDEAGWGELILNGDGTANWDMTYDNGSYETGTMNWTLDVSEPMINVTGGNPALVGEGDVMFVTDPEPDNGDDFGVNFFVKKTEQTITMAEIAGNYQTRFLESGPGGEPYTCGQGTCVIDAIDDVNGILSLNAYFSNGEMDTANINCAVGPGNAFQLFGGHVNEGIISSDKNLIFIPEYSYQNPSVREDWDWLGGIFLIRNANISDPTPSGKIIWQVVKTPYYGGIVYIIHARITIAGMTACALKGPNMADFDSAVWVPSRGQWSLQMSPMTLSQVQQESLGTWQLKLTDSSGQESIYSFTISGTLQGSEFLPLLTLLEPVPGASNLIAEHYNIRWDPNSAADTADALLVSITGNGFDYYSTTLDRSITSWNPGWLEVGNAICKIGYADYRPDMIDTPVLISGPAINWESCMASLVSGPGYNLNVKYSLDFIDDNRIDLADLMVFCSHWLEPSPNPADFDDGGMVEFKDFAIFAQHWLEDVNTIADHIFGIEIDTEWDYGAPNDSSDDEYGFSIELAADDTVDRIEFTTPAGKTFEIPSTLPTEYPIAGGWFEGGREFDSESHQYEWYYSWWSNSPSLTDYGDGLYTFTIHFVGGRVQQTTAWFGIPGTSDPIPQPTQEPVFTSFNHGDTLTSPVTFEWEPCTDSAANYIFLEYDDDNPSVEIEFRLPVIATGLDEPLDLTPGLWDDFELSFEVEYQSQNSDGIPVYAEKYSESDYIITIEEDSVSPDITWVAINDPGVSGHEAFNGYMSKYETTNAQFAQYLNNAKASGDIDISGNSVVGASGPYSGQSYYLAGSGFTYNGATDGGAARINWTGSTFTVDSGFENHPVTYVSWYGATAFASYYDWRLPTEWEWQAVADYNGSYSYGCGTTINNSIANYFNSVHPYGTTLVGQFGAYGYDMADMSGNVWEWTSTASGSNSVLCGGGWFFDVNGCAVSGRRNGSPSDRYGYYGFRVCR